jgi:hypothetical protein
VIFVLATAGHAKGPSVTRIQLLFGNGKNVVTLPPNGTLKAHAVLHYRGSGPIEGAWKVNGRVLSNFNRNLGGGRSITLTTPQTPPLPTSQIGTYKLEFVITAPPRPNGNPMLLYHVMGTEKKQ